MTKQRVDPFDDRLFWPAIWMAIAGIVVLLGVGALAELLDSKLLMWVSLLLAGGLSAPCIGMVVGADTCQRDDSPLERSTHGFLIGCAVFAACITGVVELVVKLG